MIQCFKVIIPILLLGIATSCGSTRDLAGNDLVKKNDNEITHVLDSLSGISLDYFYSKVSTHYKDSSRSVSFKTYLRIVNDSAVNARISYAGISAMNSLITPDSVLISDRREKCYVKEEMSFFKKQFGVDFTYENIEELFLAKPVGYNPSNKYFRVDPKTYTVCSHRKRDIKKNERQNKREIITYYTSTDDFSNLKSTQIISPSDTTMIEIVYDTRELVDGFMSPNKVNVTIYGPKQDISVDLEYRKTKINVPNLIHFVIPESYEKCK